MNVILLHEFIETFGGFLWDKIHQENWVDPQNIPKESYYCQIFNSSNKNLDFYASIEKDIEKSIVAFVYIGLGEQFEILQTKGAKPRESFPRGNVNTNPPIHCLRSPIFIFNKVINQHAVPFIEEER